MGNTVALELKNISKKFGDKYANKGVDLNLYNGEILAILGENGSGKTSMVNMIAGIYYPDEGEIYVDGKPVVITSPKDAFKYKIGMIHQHFKLVDVFSASENIVLGIKDDKKFKLSEVDQRVAEITNKYGFILNPQKKIHEMSVSEKQTVEILKVYPKAGTSGRNILLRITDPALLEITGGIVQGMSGSPIIQDGKLVGAVTHVLINDPTMGYGIFIENMLDAAG